MYVYVCVYIYIYIERNRERERERDVPPLRLGAPDACLLLRGAQLAESTFELISYHTFD